jgi:hypothetical protein
MILLLNHIPATLENKIAKLVELAQQAYGSDFYDIEGNRWTGDSITTESLFPKWILQEEQDDPSNVLIVQLIKSYNRWVFSLDYGYGSTIPWETIHDPQKIPAKLLVGLADMYFPYADFTAEPLSDLLPNLRSFALRSQDKYFKIKGTPQAVKYLLTTLLAIPYSDCEVLSGSPGFMIVRANVPEKYKPFLNKCVYPAGTTVLYESP